MSLVTKSEVKVGAMVLLSLALLLALTLSIGNFREYFAKTLTIYITIPSVVGLDKFSPVTYSGVRIGTVTNIWYDEQLDKAIIEAKIGSDSPVSIDSKVRFTSAGLLSPLFVEISEGSKEKRLRDLLAKGEIERNKIYLEADPYLSFGEIFAVAGDVKGVLKQVETILSGISELPDDIAGFVSEASREIVMILSKTDRILEEGQPRIITALDRVNGLVAGASSEMIPTLRDIRQGAAGVPTFVTDTHKKLNKVMDNTAGLIDTVSPEIAQLSQEAVLLIQDLRNRVQTLQDSIVKMMGDVDGLVVDNREDIGRIVTHLERTAANLNEITNELKKNPWRIIWKTEEKLPPGRVSPQWNPIQDGK